MKTIHRLWGVFAATVCAAGLVAGEATATPVLPEGTSITADPTSLLGFDASLNDYLGGGVSAVNDQNIEFLTDDFALAIDFQSDGLLRLFDNLGSGDDLFNFTLQFSFAGLDGPVTGIRPVDVSALTAGSVLFSIIDTHTLGLSLNDVQFSPGFSHLDFHVAVDEPSVLALLALVVLVYVMRRGRSSFVRSAEVAP